MACRDHGRGRGPQLSFRAVRFVYVRLVASRGGSPAEHGAGREGGDRGKATATYLALHLRIVAVVDGVAGKW